MSGGELKCLSCNKVDAERMLQCSRCKSARYCSQQCQASDWPTHKPSCGKPWYTRYQKKKLEDGSVHEGALELITWDSVTEDGDRLGWGNCFAEESDDLKHKFEVEMGGNLHKFFEYWPQGFRWTCCGAEGDVQYGCDHHGRGKKPCTCDFCRMGKPVTEKIFREKLQSAAGKGLNLPRGPDPRSYNAGMAVMSTMGRAMFGMDM